MISHFGDEETKGMGAWTTHYLSERAYILNIDEVPWKSMPCMFKF
jgi:hypothetical protein